MSPFLKPLTIIPHIPTDTIYFQTRCHTIHWLILVLRVKMYSHSPERVIYTCVCPSDMDWKNPFTKANVDHGPGYLWLKFSPDIFVLGWMDFKRFMTEVTVGRKQMTAITTYCWKANFKGDFSLLLTLKNECLSPLTARILISNTSVCLPALLTELWELTQY